MQYYSMAKPLSTRILTAIILSILLTACGTHPVTPGAATAASVPKPTPTNPLPLATATNIPKPSISIQPPAALIDQPTSIRISGFTPGQQVILRATCILSGYTFESAATFQVDSSGEVDLDKQAPLSGSYTGVDGMGLFWSMKPKSGPSTALPAQFTLFLPGDEVDLQIHYTFTAEVDGASLAQASAVRYLGSPGLVVKEVRENGLVGILYQPPGAGPFPGVIVLGGSEGGLVITPDAILLASHGYAALALAYFDPSQSSQFAPLPAMMTLLPLEYFGKAIQWLQSQPGIDPQRIGMIGWSMGGQAALLVGGVYPQVKTVIAISAPIFVYGVGKNSTEFVSRWTYQGQPVPFLTSNYSEFKYDHPYLEAVSSGKDPLPLLQDIKAGMEADPELAKATIPVEKIEGSILLITGTYDSVIPSTLYAEIAIDQLKAHKFGYPYQHIINPGAGHSINFPFLPAWNDKFNVLGTPFGTDAKALAQAEEISWPVILEYLAAMK